MKNKNIEFMKISGSGNDFIIINNMDNKYNFSSEYIKSLCKRRIGIGADGLILLNKCDKYDFRMKYYNSDGFEADMCGNGGRSVVLFAFLNGIIKKREIVFCSKNSVHRAYIKDNNIVKLELSPPHSFQYDINIESMNIKGDFLNTGVPHFVILSNDIENENVFEKGKTIRYDSKFKPNGTNVDFIQLRNNEIILRTYERGVEDETLACGTGAVASAIIAYKRYKLQTPIKVRTRSNELLKVEFECIDNKFKNVFLEGRVEPIYKGNILI